MNPSALVYFLLNFVPYFTWKVHSAPAEQASCLSLSIVPISDLCWMMAVFSAIFFFLVQLSFHFFSLFKSMVDSPCQLLFNLSVNFLDRPFCVLSGLCIYSFATPLFPLSGNLVTVLGWFCLFICLLVHYPCSPKSMSVSREQATCLPVHHWLAYGKRSINASSMDGWMKRWMGGCVGV